MAEIIRFTLGEAAQLVALKFDGGKNVDGQFGRQVMFTTTDGRQFYMDERPASEFEIELRQRGIRPGTPFGLRKTKASHGGHQWIVEMPPANGDAGGHNVPQRAYVAQGTASTAPRDVTPALPAITSGATQPNGIALTNDARCMMSAMCAAVDAVIETQQYAARKGLGVTFSEESVRAIGLSIYISACKGGAR